ncbi:MAG: WD40 repeat domain-containing protein, partial [Candidatus Xenobia bacterium]
TPGGHFLATGSEDKTVQLWNLTTGKRAIAPLKGHDRDVVSVAVTPEARHIISASKDRQLKVWNVDDPTIDPTMIEGHTRAVTAVRLTDDCSIAITTCDDGVVRLWHLDWDLEGHEEVDWTDAANACIDMFLSHRYAELLVLNPDLINEPHPFEDPNWSEEDLDLLLHDLANWGFGYLNPEGVRHRLREVSQAWGGPPVLAAQPR